MLNSGVTTDIMLLLSTVFIMLINNGIVTAVISKIQLNITVLINETAAGCIFAANQIIYIRGAVKVIVARLTVCRHVAVIQAVNTGGCFMCPLRTITQPHIDFACMIGTGVINNTLPGGILSSQADIQTAVLIYVRLIGTLGALQSNNVTDDIGCLAFGSLQLFIFNRAFIRIIISINNVDIDCTAIACQSIICFLKAAVCFSFVRRSFDFNRIAYQADFAQIIVMHACGSIVHTGLHSSTAYSHIHITVNGNAAAGIANAESIRLPTCAGIVNVSRIHGGYAAGTDVAVNVVGNNAPRIRRVILAHLHVAVDNQVAAACTDTNGSICGISIDIQITVDFDIAVAAGKACYVAEIVRMGISLAQIQSTLAAVTAYVVINIVVAVFGSNSILIHYGKGVVCALKIIGNGFCAFIKHDCVAVSIKHRRIFICFTRQAFIIFCGPGRLCSKA